MKYFDLTLPTPAGNLACDEALLDLCEHGGGEEILRFWEPQTPFVVLGYANRATQEVNLRACEEAKIGVFRRCSGGGTVLQGPGCLNYSLILRIDGKYETDSPARPLESIAGTNQFILERQRAALEPLLSEAVQMEGQTDLAIGGRKFSGNAQRRLRKCLIFHGTFLLNFDLALVEKFLPMPSKQPCYREDRSHAEFLANLNLPSTKVKAALRKVWGAEEPFGEVPRERIRELELKKYAMTEWNLKF